jgi:CheY-like chemotaxis protein
MLATKEYDLILLDHMMPGMDGVETFHHIRKKPDIYYKQIPIIALTANAIAGAREMFMKEGFDDFVAKPVESSVLQRALKRHLPVSKLLTMEEADRIMMEAKQSGEVLQEIESTCEFEIGDLDVAKGIMYCGNQKNYLEILTSQRDSGKDTLEQVQNLFETEDWKNYVIVVHGIKSAMMSIGAVKLSEMAKALEFAGKGEDFGFIRREHDVMITEFKRVMQLLDEFLRQRLRNMVQNVVYAHAMVHYLN